MKHFYNANNNHNNDSKMNKEKDYYTSPEVDVIKLCFEGIICQSVPGGTEPGDIIPGGWDALI